MVKYRGLQGTLSTIRSIRRYKRHAATGLASTLVTAVLLAIASGPAPASAAALSIAVQGNHFVNGDGRTVRLLGVDRSGSEYMCTGGGGQTFDGPIDDPAIAAIVAWHTNAVRLPLNEDCWLGINGLPNGQTAASYQAAITDFVNRLHAQGQYVILDLHWNNGGTAQATGQEGMADADHAPAFWTSVATAFKSDPAVVFDLYNEPHDITWDCWKNGGCTDPVDGFTVAGMQSLLDAVRATGATQPIMAGGLGWSGDLSQWLTFMPNDPLKALVASFHTYNFSGCDSTCWTTTVQPVTANVPVVTGELGENDCAHGYIDRYMTWADAHGVSYFGWAWNTYDCGSFPSLISDDTGTPTAFGVGLQSHLASLAGGPPPLSASSSASTTTGVIPLTVKFTGSASGGTAPYAFAWNFGDSGTSSAQNPSHTFTTAGTFSVNLTVTDAAGSHASAAPLSIVASPLSQLVATSSASPTSGAAPLTVNFAASASGGTAPYTFAWNFGDGGTSSSQNPSHTYMAAGTFSATLTVGDAAGVHASPAPISITATSAAQLAATSSASATSGLIPLTVNFTGSASGGTAPYTFAWSFGDGATSSMQNPSHTFSSVGTFSVILSVTDSASGQAWAAPISITVTSASGNA